MSNFEQARADIDGTSWLDDLARASLTAAAAKFENRHPATLAVDINANIDAGILAAVSQGMQDAVARMSRHITHPDSDANRIMEDDRSRARLFPRRQIGRRIEFGFEDLDVAEPGLFAAEAASAAELAVRELIEILPESNEDLASIEAMPARDRAILNVVQDIVKTVEQTAGVGLTLSSTTGGRAIGVMTKDQAFTISSELLESEQERQIVTVDGRLDGLRTRRRLFYLETEGRDFEGVYDPELAAAVKRHVDTPVRARIEMVRSIKRTGSPGRWSYRLLALTDRPQGDHLFVKD